METNYKRTVAGSVGAGMAAVFNASGRQYYILEHKTESLYHHVGESQKIIVDQVELGRDSACQVRFDESFETVSRRHAAIVREGDNWKIIPISQTNSTLVNGQPIMGEAILKSGDEIRLSSKGPLMGFIVPQGKQSLVSSIGMTERLSLFRQQALRPYKRGLWALAIILILAVAGLVAWNLWQADKFTKEIENKQQQIDKVQEDLSASDELIETLNDELIQTQNASAAERARVQKKLDEAREAREALIREAEGLKSDLQRAADNAVKAGENVDAAQAKIDALQRQIDEADEKAKKAADSIKKVQEEAAASELKLFGKEERQRPELSKDKKDGGIQHF